MENVRLPAFGQFTDPFRQSTDLPQFAPGRAAVGDAGCAEKGQAIDHMLIRTGQWVTQAGNAGNLPPHRLLGLHDGPGAKCVAALRRQTVVEDVEYTGHECG